MKSLRHHALPYIVRMIRSGRTRAALAQLSQAPAARPAGPPGRVYRIAVGYAAAAYVLLQALSLLLPVLPLPGWTFRAIVVAVIALFPPVMVLTWIFDVMPGSIRRTRAVCSPASGCCTPRCRWAG
jgi:hypothetical protein